MAYLVLARKWRPRGFDAITGQEHVTRTLKNAITQDRVHHAFLFCGARGVGKTSAARVLARALNCRNADKATVEPCGECPACTEIAAGTCVDVFEIDGASNRGIGEIRELRDGVAYAPQRDRYKVYIIDEVHMLTTEAFNALLKTLEEPPSHVKFIFATTEPHKIPVTILSRCQRFDFKRIPLTVMSQRLNEILVAEGVRMDPAGLRLVARESEGSMRDALSLLDRVISFAGTEASHEAVASVLGVADRAWLQRLVSAALDKDIPAALAVVGEAFDYGLDLKKFASDFVHHLRDAAVLQVAGEGAPTDLSREERDSLIELGKRIAPEDLQRLVRLWTETAERLVQASFPRFEVEMAVIRMCRLRPMQPLEQLLGRLEAIERRLASGVPLPPLSEPAPPRPKAEAQAPRLGEVVISAPDTSGRPSSPPVPVVPPPVDREVNVFRAPAEPLAERLTVEVAPLASSEVVPLPASSEVVPLPASSEVVHLPASSEVVPLPASSEVVPLRVETDVAPLRLASEESPLPLNVEATPLPLEVEVAPLPLEVHATETEASRPEEGPSPALELAPRFAHIETPGVPTQLEDSLPEKAAPVLEAAVPKESSATSSQEAASKKGRARASSKIAEARNQEPKPAAEPLPARAAPPEQPAKSRGRARAKTADGGPAKQLAPSGPLDAEVWEAIVELIRPEDAVLAGILDHARISGFAEGTLSLEVAGEVTEKRLLAKLSDISSLVKALRPEVQQVRIGRVSAVANTPHMRRAERRSRAEEARRRDVEKHPLVLELIERFGATLSFVEVEDTDEARERA